MKITPNELKEGDEGIIVHWVNQPDYIGNIIYMLNNEMIMIDKNGLKTKNIDMRHPHFCKILLN